MENASKALIMAASILIGVMIISFAVFLITMFADNTKTLQKKMDDRVIAEFNQYFTKYYGMNDVTIHDIVGLANYARTNNKKYQLEQPKAGTYYVRVTLRLSGMDYNLENDDWKVNNKKDITYFLKNESIIENTNTVDNVVVKEKKIKNYRCTGVSFDDATGRVNQIIFSD